MKKIILCALCSTVALALVGCSGNSTSSAVKDLNRQLEHVESSISTISKQDLSSLNFSTNNNTPAYYGVGYNNYSIKQNNLQNSNSNMLLSARSKVSNDIKIQSQISNDINKRIENIQASLKNNKTKYSKNQIKAIKSLSGQLGNYASKLNDSKNETKTALKIINYSQNVNHMSIDQLNAGYNSISNTLETRKAYYYNILNTLSQIENIVSSCDDCNNEYSNDEGNTQEQTENNNDNTSPRRNINIPDNFNANKNLNNTTNQLPPRVIDNTNNYYNQYPYYNNAYGYYNGYYGNGYGMNGYGINGYYNGMNPSRNTDTYRPYRINIDTYRITPNNNAIQNNRIYGDETRLVSLNDEIPEKTQEFEDAKLQTKPNAKKLVDQNKEMTHLKKLPIKKQLPANNHAEKQEDGVDPIDQITHEDETPKKVRLNENSEEENYTKPIKSNHHIFYITYAQL